MKLMLPRENKSSCEHEVMLAPGQSLPRGSSLSWVHVNRPLIRQMDYHRANSNRSGSAILRQAFVQVREKVSYIIKKLRHDYCGKKIKDNKKLYWAFGRQANRLTLNVPVLQGLLRVNRKAEKEA